MNMTNELTATIEQHNLTQHEAARIMGVSRVMVANYIAGRWPVPEARLNALRYWVGQQAIQDNLAAKQQKLLKAAYTAQRKGYSVAVTFSFAPVWGEQTGKKVGVSAIQAGGDYAKVLDVLDLPIDLATNELESLPRIILGR